MRHFVLTRAAYDPSLWPKKANLRRLRLFEGVTARSLAAQIEQNWVWAVVLNEADPFYVDRREVILDTGLDTRILTARIEMGTRKEAAHSAYKVGWADSLSLEGGLLTTRCDDDDALAPDAIARIQDACLLNPARHRTVWVMPEGYRVARGRYESVRHETNAWITLQAPDGDTAVVYDFGHKRVADYAKVQKVDEDPGWLWVRHRDVQNGHKNTPDRLIDHELRERFPIDWKLLEAA